MTDTESAGAGDTVREWVRSVVIGHNLCPFAARELQLGRIRFAVSGATTANSLIDDLSDELARLADTPSIETTVLIHPQVLTRFDDYNQFLDAADALVAAMGFEGVFQIASFHPDYCFADSDESDSANFTNRSPYPLLHLLREESLSRVIEQYGDTSQIPERNVRHLHELGIDEVGRLLRRCSAVR